MKVSPPHITYSLVFSNEVPSGEGVASTHHLQFGIVYVHITFLELQLSENWVPSSV